MRARLKVSRTGVELIKSFEGLRPTAAKLPDGRWTLGYGHTLSAREGAQVTADDAEALLRFDLLPIVDAVNTLVTVPLNQNQFDAMVSFCFNIGVDNFTSSLVLKRLNEGLMAEAALAMDSWRSAEYNGETYVLAPLIRRRTAEKALFAMAAETVASPVVTPVVVPVVAAEPSADEARQAAEAAEAAQKLEQERLAQAARAEAEAEAQTQTQAQAQAQAQLQAQAEAEAAQRRAEDENRLREEALRQAEALAAARLAAEAAAAEMAQKAAEQAAKEAEAKALEDKRLIEDRRLAEEKCLAEEAAAKEAAAKEAALQAEVPAPPPLDEEAEKARKAEAAAALMRLYSPYGVSARGALPTSQRLGSPVAPAPVPIAPVPVVPVAPIGPDPQTEERPSIQAFTPHVSPSNMPPPIVAVLSSVAAAAAVVPIVESGVSPQVETGFEPQPEAEPITLSSEPEADIAVQAEPEPVSEPVASISEPAAPVARSLHWREQLQRPLPQDYRPQDYQPQDYQAPAYDAPVTVPASDFAPQPSAAASAFTETYAEAPEEWMLDGGRIALSSEEMEEEGVSWWKMIVSTMSWILLSCFGLACLGVASAAWWMGRNDPGVERMGHIQNYTTVSIITAIAGILFVSISVWLIMKRLGGLKD